MLLFRLTVYFCSGNKSVLKYFFFCLVFFASLPVRAQYEHLVHKPYADRIDGYFYLYQDLIGLKDFQKIQDKTEEVRRFAREKKDRDLNLEMDLFLVYYDAFFNKAEPQKAVTAITGLIDRSEKEKVFHINVRAIRVLALYYWDQGQYESSFEQYMILDKKLSSTNVYDYPELVRDLLKVGEAYYFFQDYEQAKKYFERIIRLPETAFNTMFMNSARNTLGLCYQKQKDYARSDYYFNEILKTDFPEPKRIWKRIAMGNLGANQYYLKNYDKALPLLKYDFDEAGREGDYGPAAGAAILLADIFLQRNNRKEAWQYIQSAFDNIEKSGQKERLRDLYPVVSKWYIEEGQHTLSKAYLDSTLAATRRYHEQFSAISVLRARQKLSLQEEKLRNAEAELTAQKKDSERRIMVIVMLALIIIIVLGYSILKRDQYAKDMKIKAATQKLEAAQLDLSRFAERITEKNRLIEQLSDQRSEEEKVILINQLKQSSILTEEDWYTYQRTFDSAYPGFISRVKERFPNLSLSEMRYFVLLKLNLSYKEMAVVQGVSPNTIQVLRHRLRKKFNLDSNGAIEEMLRKI